MLLALEEFILRHINTTLLAWTVISCALAAPIRMSQPKL